jgi:hypothetical protein
VTMRIPIEHSTPDEVSRHLGPAPDLCDARRASPEPWACYLTWDAGRGIVAEVTGQSGWGSLIGLGRVRVVSVNGCVIRWATHRAAELLPSVWHESLCCRGDAEAGLTFRKGYVEVVDDGAALNVTC